MAVWRGWRLEAGGWRLEAAVNTWPHLLLTIWTFVRSKFKKIKIISMAFDRCAFLITH
jgi:hypothetical protein